MNKVQVAIMRPSCEHHKEVTYLESLLLYMTQECRKVFSSLIKCEYWSETAQIKRWKGFKPMILADTLQGVNLKINKQIARFLNLPKVDFEKN